MPATDRSWCSSAAPLQFRAVDPSTRELVDELAARGLSAVHYDRPGRGDSSGVGASLAAEVDAVRALIAETGGHAALYGSCSGAGIALVAATEVRGINDLVLWEPSFGPKGGTQGADGLAALQAVLPSGDPELIIGTFMQGMPPQWFDQLRASTDWPAYAAMAPPTPGPPGRRAGPAGAAMASRARTSHRPGRRRRL